MVIEFEKYEGEGTPDAVFRVCHRVTPTFIPVTTSAEATCDHCDAPIWFNMSQKTLVKEDFLVCVECAIEHLGMPVLLPNNNHPPEE